MALGFNSIELEIVVATDKRRLSQSAYKVEGAKASANRLARLAPRVKVLTPFPEWCDWCIWLGSRLAWLSCKGL